MSQEFDKNKLDLVKKKGCHPFKYMTDFKSLKKNYIGEKFCNSSTGKKNIEKEYDHVFKI